MMQPGQKSRPGSKFAGNRQRGRPGARDPNGRLPCLVVRSLESYNSIDFFPTLFRGVIPCTQWPPCNDANDPVPLRLENETPFTQRSPDQLVTIAVGFVPTDFKIREEALDETSRHP
jgi:hypothetical protein